MKIKNKNQLKTSFEPSLTHVLYCVYLHSPGGEVTVKDMRTYLDIKRPPVVDSAYGMADKYRISEVTARSCLRESGYYLEETPTNGNGRRWVRQETQLDRIERLLEQLYQVSMKDWLASNHVEQS